MTLREFIEQEIENRNVLDMGDLCESLEQLESSDGEELDKYTYQDYLDCDIEWANIKINYSHFGGTAWYEIELAEDE